VKAIACASFGIRRGTRGGVFGCRHDDRVKREKEGTKGGDPGIGRPKGSEKKLVDAIMPRND